MSAAVGLQSTPAPLAPRVRLDYLDGLRGLAALYVVLNHTSIRMGTQTNADTSAPAILGKLVVSLNFFLLAYGHYAVAVFIVLSGYCLMLPVARSANGELRGGFWEFMKRRARRILPPYYAAMAISLALSALAAAFGIVPSWHKLTEPAFTPGVLLSHLFLVHNWTPYNVRIDPPMWSVAVEWQIYFFFPLLLLPVYRRFGSAVMVLVSFSVALIGHFLFGSLFDRGHFWFLGLFGMGMAGAALNFSPALQKSWASRLPWAAISAVFTALIVLVSAAQRETWRNVPTLHWFRLETWGGDWPVEILAGVATIALMICFTRRVIEGTAQNLAIYRLLNSRFAVTLGVFSYSLYLIHDPMLECITTALRTLPAVVFVPVLLFVGVPVAVGVAYLFHLAFEKRFMPAHFQETEKRLHSSGSALDPVPVKPEESAARA